MDLGPLFDLAAGPLLAGTAISLSSGVFESTKGYQATWGVCAAAILLSLLPVRALRRRVMRSGAPG